MDRSYRRRDRVLGSNSNALVSSKADGELARVNRRIGGVETRRRRTCRSSRASRSPGTTSPERAPHQFVPNRVGDVWVGDWARIGYIGALHEPVGRSILFAGGNLDLTHGSNISLS